MLLALLLPDEGGLATYSSRRCAKHDEDDDGDRRGVDRIRVEAAKTVAEAQCSKCGLDRLVPGKGSDEAKALQNIGVYRGPQP